MQTLKSSEVGSCRVTIGPWPANSRVRNRPRFSYMDAVQAYAAVAVDLAQRGDYRAFQATVYRNKVPFGKIVVEPSGTSP